MDGPCPALHARKGESLADFHKRCGGVLTEYMMKTGIEEAACVTTGGSS